MKTKRQKPNNQQEPEPCRPRMPGYGLSESREGLLAWSWARTHLEKAHNYYLATTRRSGAPHLMPVWGIWLDDAFYFSTGTQSLKARNLRADPRCSLSTERGDEAVIVEGTARKLAPRRVPHAFFKLYEKKYGWEMKGEPVYLLRPRRAFAFIEAADDFYKTATRWTFDSSK
jgi:nitroimidazol reductase NimA-like FMN-containing flavoprotein (pyridoxamine 5'-phosphate oxidase superfamily)